MKKTLLINFFGVIFIIFFLEIIIRVFNFAGLQGYDKNFFYSENGFALNKPNNQLKVFGKYARIDSNGFRVPLDDSVYDKNKTSILFLGDSVSFGVGVKEKETFIGLLRGKSNKNILNASVSGHNLESYLYFIEKYNNKLDSKFNEAIIFLCLNDIISYQGVLPKKTLTENNDNNKFIENNVKNNISLKINIFLREKSTLFVFLKGLLTNPAKRHYNYISWMYKNEESLKQYKKSISKIAIFSKSKNIKTTFVLLPYAYQINNKCELQFMVPQSKIKKIFEELNLVIYDYSYKFCNNPMNKFFFLPFDPVHLSTDGHKYVNSLLIKDNLIKQ